jgi:hypothetical protein
MNEPLEVETIVEDIFDRLFLTVQEKWGVNLDCGPEKGQPEERLGVGFEFPDGGVFRLQARYHRVSDDTENE